MSKEDKSIRFNKQNNDNRNKKHSEKEDNKKEWINKFQSEWIVDRLNQDAIKYCEELGGFLKDKNFTTSQIRNFFGEVRRIEMKGINNETTAFLLLKPKLAYAEAREEKKNEIGIAVFHAVLTNAIDKVLENNDKDILEKRFKNFVDMLEAILAYHRAAGGK